MKLKRGTYQRSKQGIQLSHRSGIPWKNNFEICEGDEGFGVEYKDLAKQKGTELCQRRTWHILLPKPQQYTVTQHRLVGFEALCHCCRCLEHYSAAHKKLRLE